MSLDHPGLELRVTPSNGETDLDTDGLTTSEFLTREHCTLAVNASPFSPVWQESGAPKDILGLSISDGEVYSRPHPTFSSIVFDTDGRAHLEVPPIAPERLAHAAQAVGGFEPLVQDGTSVADRSTTVLGVHPRTAVGIADEGRTLYISIVDGRQAGYSEGATLGELADDMLALGVDDALNLDGGGSTSLVVRGPDGPEQLNSPIHSGIRGRERVIGNHLCVRSPRRSTTDPARE